MTMLSKKEAAKYDKDTAKIVCKLFDKEIKIYQNKATDGDNEASHKFMELITAKGWALRQLGLMTSENSRRLVKFKPWDGKY